MRLASIVTIMDKPKHQQVALRRALALQQLSHAHIDAVSFCWQSLADASDAFDASQRRAMKREILGERKTWQRACAGEVNLARGDVSLKTIWSDDLAAWITDATNEHDYDLLVKTAHYSKTLVHTPLDWQLLRECPAPILLTSTRRKRPSNIVLAALDLSRLDRTHQRLNKSVLDAASGFATLVEAKLHCVYVIEVSQVLRDLDIVNAREVRRKIIARTSDALAELLEPYSVPNARIHLPVNKVGQATRQMAQKLNADLLVMGTNAHRVRRSIGLGNSAERILSRVPCDVLAVHP